MNDIMLQEFARDLFPGFGFFGQRPGLRLEIPVGRSFDRIEVSFDDGAVQEYAFPGISVIKASGAESLLDKFDIDIATSSQHFTLVQDQLVARVRAGQFVRTAAMARPHMSISFASAPDVSTIVLSNARYPFARRSKIFFVRFFSGGNMVHEYIHNDPQRLVNEFISVHQALGLRMPAANDTIYAHSEMVRRELIDWFDQGKPDWSALRLGQFLPLFQEKPNLSTFSLRVLAETMIALLNARMSVPTSTCAIFGCLMDTEAKIETVIAEMNRILSARLGRSVNLVAAKHSIQEPVLIAHRDRLLASLDQIFPAFEACGVTAMVCYGALLGAIREGGFLGHDDDVDLIYFDGSTSREEMMARRANVIAGLAKQGFKREDKKDMINFHVRDRNAKLDIFPTWCEGDKLFCMMAYPNYKAIPLSVILPVGRVALHGHSYPAPADPAAFLNVRYGPTWQKSDPYFEWPWPLEGRRAGRIVGKRNLFIRFISKVPILEQLGRRFTRPMRWAYSLLRKCKG